MKRFTQKFFMLSAAMLLSVGAFAQGDGIAHRYPEFTFTSSVKMPDGTYETLTFTMPAWDAYVSTEIPAGTGMGYRLQLIENPVDKNTPARARIVAPRAFSHENTVATGDRWFASLDGGADIIVTKPDGTTLPTTTSSVTYGDIFGSDTPEPSAKPFTFTKTSNSNNSPTNDLTIQYIRDIQGGKWKGYKFKIVEIGEAAFRNGSPTSQNVSSISGTVTIPKTIEKIENNAFRHGVFNKVVFEEGSQITTIEKATFEGCPNLVEVNIPASVTKIEGTAFGSCKNLNKIVFEGNLPTLTKVDEEPFQPSVDNYKGPYNFYQGATRLQHSAASVGDNLTPSKCIIEVPLGTAKSYIEFDQNNGEENSEPYYLFAQFPMSSKFPITTSSGLMTYCSDVDFTFKQYDTSSSEPTWTDGDVKVYYVEEQNVEIENSRVVLTEVTGDVMVSRWVSETEDFGVVLKGTSGETYNIFYPNGNGITDKLTMEGTGNVLKGCVTSTEVDATDENNSYFILSGGVFKRIMTKGNCKANRAYIMVSGGPDISGGEVTDSKDLSLSFPGEDPTGITTHEVQDIHNDAYYTLQGIQVKQPQKGIVIKNGKKFVIK